jgi:transcriptional regulator GlxA family with amidase domain
MKNNRYNWKINDVEIFQCLAVYMKNNLSKELRLKDLAVQAAINEDKLKKGFHYFFSTTVHQFLLRIRMERAYELVSQTDKPFKEIAALVGYRPRNFFHCFKKYFGDSPGELRKKLAPNSHIRLL